MPSIRIQLAIVLGLIAIGGAALAGPQMHLGGMSGGMSGGSAGGSGPGEGAANRMLEMLDTNGDQILDKSEIGAPSLRWFARYDVNQDGTIVSDEIGKLRHAR